MLALQAARSERYYMAADNYIHSDIIGHYITTTSVRIIDLVSHTTYFVCVNFIDKSLDRPTV